jgi:hypothetical protein
VNVDRTPAVRVLVANEPLAYREVLAGSLRLLRPDAEVVEVDPDEIEVSVRSARPDLVFASRIDARILAWLPAWAIVYPGGAQRVETCVAGERATATDLELADALALVDRVAALTAARRAPAPSPAPGAARSG